MRICLVSHLTSSPDEGVRRIAASLGRALRVHNKVEFLSVMRPDTWWRVRHFQPEVIHFVLSPTWAGMITARAISLIRPRARTIISAPHPEGGAFSRLLSPFRPDLVLAQSNDSEQKFRDLGYRTAFLPNGVDIKRFAPVNEARKRHLREKFGIGDRFVVLHVGPPKRGRNVQALGSLQNSNRQVLVVGRPSDPAEKRIVDELQARGCMVWSDYVDSIEEIYSLSDCYVFPTTERRHCIEMPLSVLEAMACNLPVVTTFFGALPRIADEGQGLFYAQSREDFKRDIEMLEANSVVVNTRKRVMGLSWGSVARQLERIYDRELA